MAEQWPSACALAVLRRDALFIVSKIYPHNAGAAGARAACERSLARLGIDHLDCYLLHWRGGIPLAETIDAFEELRSRGRIRAWGVSNFDLDDMRELFETHGGDRCATNQVYLSLSQRGPEFGLLPWHQQRGLVTMAYSPIDQGVLADSAALQRIASRAGVTAPQLALAWLAEKPGVMALPKAVTIHHLQENFAAQALMLSADIHAELDRAFAPPARQTPLAMR